MYSTLKRRFNVECTWCVCRKKRRSDLQFHKIIVNTNIIYEELDLQSPLY